MFKLTANCPTETLRHFSLLTSLTSSTSYLCTSTSHFSSSHPSRQIPSSRILTMDTESAKRNAAHRAVADHFPLSGAKYIGIGSGTTIVYVLDAITSLPHDLSSIRFVPTGYQSRQHILSHGLTPIAFDSLPKDTLLDVAFDGADEVDEDLNCIKGGGACLYQEKLVATHARKFICVADYRKLQPRLLTKWPSIPIEVEPLAAGSVLSTLRSLGSKSPVIRTGPMDKAGPLKTDQANFIIDAPFHTLRIQKDLEEKKELGEGEWEVEEIGTKIKLIEGVLSVGIFSGENGEEAIASSKGRMGGQKPVAAYFGMADGGVVVRSKEGEKRVE